MGTSRMDSSQAWKNTNALLKDSLPQKARAANANAVVGIKIDVHDTFTVIYGTAVTVEPEPFTDAARD